MSVTVIPPSHFHSRLPSPLSSLQSFPQSSSQSLSHTLRSYTCALTLQCTGREIPEHLLKQLEEYRGSSGDKEATSDDPSCLCTHLSNVSSLILSLSSELSEPPPSLSKIPYLCLEDLVDLLPLSRLPAELVPMLSPDSPLANSLSDPAIFKSGSLILLRIANSLLERLPTHTDYLEARGTVLRYLAGAFNLTERSGVNLKGAYRPPTTQPHPPKPKTPDFWSVLPHLVKPDPADLPALTAALDTVLACLESHPFTKSDFAIIEAEHKSLAAGSSAQPPPPPPTSYLTMPDLLPLQVRDPDFHLTLLSNLLISLTPPPVPALRRYLPRIRNLLSQTPPNGPHVLALLTNLTRRPDKEPNWRSWKDRGCPDFTTTPVDPPSPKDMSKYTKMTAKASMYAPPQALPPLSQSHRSTVPFPVPYLTPHADALDPESGIDPEYDPGNDPVWRWRAERLIRRCGRFGDLEEEVRGIWKEDPELEDIPERVTKVEEKEEAEDEEVAAKGDKEEEAAAKGVETEDEEAEAEGNEEEDGDAEGEGMEVEGEDKKDEEVYDANGNEPLEDDAGADAEGDTEEPPPKRKKGVKTIFNDQGGAHTRFD